MKKLHLKIYVYYCSKQLLRVLTFIIGLSQLFSLFWNRLSLRLLNTKTTEMVSIKRWSQLLVKIELFTVLLAGVFIGFMFAYYLVRLADAEKISFFGYQPSRNATLRRHGPFADFEGLGDVGIRGLDEKYHRDDDDSVAQLLYEKVKVLCWVMTGPDNHQKKAIHVKATWGQRCNVLLFMSSANDSSLPTVALPVGEGRENLWAKTKEAFKYVYYNHLDDADWFLKADDDTYVVLENVRLLLSEYNTFDALYFGHQEFTVYEKGHMHGGPGYILSKEAVRRFVEEAVPDPNKCRQDGGGLEDAEMGRCLRNVDVPIVESVDTLGRGRFFIYSPEGYVNHPNDCQGSECPSDYTISFHYISPELMYVMEFLLYHLKPWGITSKYRFSKKQVLQLTHSHANNSHSNSFN